jgi:4'-phosphopantetheinyl transferase EntD
VGTTTGATGTVADVGAADFDEPPPQPATSTAVSTAAITARFTMSRSLCLGAYSCLVHLVVSSERATSATIDLVTTLIGGLLPPGAVAVEMIEPMAPQLLAEEAVALGRASDKRRDEFAAGRACARQALSSLGVAPVAILRGVHREPIWPAGVVGSITHCAGYCAAAVARAADITALGIDAEPAAPLPDRVLDRIGLDSERSWVESQVGDAWDRLLFSAKESVFKAWFPLTGRWLGFHDASVTFDLQEGTFAAELRVPVPILGGTPLDVFSGRFVRGPDFVVTAVVLGAESIRY